MPAASTDSDNSDLISRMLSSRSSGSDGKPGNAGSEAGGLDGSEGDEEFAAFLEAMAKNPQAAALLQSAIEASEKNGPGKDLPFPEDAGVFWVLRSCVGVDRTGLDSAAMASVLAALTTGKKEGSTGPTSDQMMQIRPSPGFVIKTHLAARKEDWPEGMKVFINLCHSADIPPPPTMDYEEVARAMLESDNVSFKVPLSLSAPRTDKDKAGKLCLVFDAACNTTPFEHCTKDASFHAFIVTLCCEWIESKHELQLSRDVSFPKLKSKGEISIHTIRKQSKSIITEMSKTQSAAAGSAAAIEAVAQTRKTPSVSSTSSKSVTPHHEVFAEPPAGRPEFLVVRVSLPQLTTIKNNLVLDVESNKLILSPVGKIAQDIYKMLEIELEHEIVLEEVGAQFDLSTRTLTVTLLCLVIGNIPYDVTEQQLIEILSEVGPVSQFRLVFDKETGKAKGFGFCTFHDSETAASAVRNLNNFDIGGRQLRIDFAEQDTKDEPPSRFDDRKPSGTAPYSPKPVIATGSSTDAINKALETIPAQQLLEAMAQLKLMAVNAPDQVRALLSGNPQLTYAIFQAMIAMNVIDANILQQLGQAPVAPVVAPPPAPVVVQQQNTGVLGSTGFAPAPIAPVQAAAAGLVDPEQQKLLMQVLSMTPEQIQALPLDQRAGVIQLRAQLGLPRTATKDNWTRAQKVEDRLREILADLKECRLTLHDIQDIKEQLCQIDELIVDAAVHERDGSIAPGQAVIAELLDECHEISSQLQEELDE
ncbi:UNVERIFIED_CONTAM: hypothetical protein HDU68_004590 [Siphonaria sp. JEL0065]|nr:hypothetical protein HDU68_004590 [Siphonaria sp. JEL0065]